MSVTLPPAIVALFRDNCNSQKLTEYELFYKLEKLYKSMNFKLKNLPYSFPIDETCTDHITAVIEGRLTVLSQIRETRTDQVDKKKFYSRIMQWIDKMVQEKQQRMVKHDAQCRDWSSYFTYEHKKFIDYRNDLPLTNLQDLPPACQESI